MMNKVLNFIKSNYILLIIIFFAFTVRLYGIYFDFPATRYIHDETYEVSYIVKALAEGTIYPNVTLQYSFFLAILYLPFLVLKLLFIMLREGIYSLFELKEYMMLYGMGELIVITRWFSVLFGAATVYLSYIIGKLIWNKKSALVIAAGFAFSFVPVFLSHWGRRHMIMAFFILLTLYFVLRFQKSKNKKWFYYSNLAASLAVASHYLGINALIFPFTAYLMNRKALNIKDLFNNFLIYIVSFSLFYLANWNGFVWMIKANLGGHYGEGSIASLSSIGTFERFYYLFRDLFFISPLISLLGFALVYKIKSLWRNKLLRYIIFGFLFNYLIMISLVASPHNTRWLIIFSVYLTIFVFGCFSDYIFRRIKNLILVYILIVIILLPGGFMSLKYGYLLNQNTRVEAQTWIKNNIKKENKIYSFDYIVELPLSVEAAKWQIEENKVNSTKNKYILGSKDELNTYGYNLFYDFGNKRYEGLGGEDTVYVLFSYTDINNKKNIIDELNKYYQLKLTKTFFPSNYIATGDSVNNPNNILRLLRLDKSGPYIEIYKIK